MIDNLIAVYWIGFSISVVVALVPFFAWALDAYYLVECFRRVAMLVAGVLFWPVVAALFVIWGCVAGLKEIKKAIQTRT